MGDYMYGSLGANLRVQRFKKNLTQEEVAKAIGTSHSMIGRYERNKTRPRRGTLQKLADFYGVSMEEITGDNEFFS
ncbi:helix-turn-helix domain-containing protein [Cytobacillus firmus]|uniref:helix-turn-helix domain-containing protein n=1 Tax=Cytobacillus firmus TaxID=1399 RepID=UPI0021C98B48|nr:helix-turn-helix transcriptional regulator [Cytobacillus firmus]